MIRRLKRKFVITAMLLVITVLILMFCSIYWLTAKNLEQESLDLMKRLSADSETLLGNFLYSDDSPVTEQMPPVVRQFRAYRSAFALYIYDEEHSYQVSGFASYEGDRDTYLNHVIRLTMQKNETIGRIPEYDLRYYNTSLPNGRKIILLDSSYETAILQTLLFTLCIVGSASLLLFFLVCLLIARIAVSPTEKSQIQQKQLISDMSHELKTPIAVIDASMDIVRTHASQTVAEQHKWIDYIHTETQRMSTLVSDLLLLARSNESQEAASGELVQFSDLAYSVALPFESICFEEHRQFEIQIEPNLYIRAQEKSIRQLISILLDNACKYAQENGCITIRIYAESDRALLLVQNTGEVIPPDKLNLVFDRFFRVDNARIRSAGGHGLGLAIAKKITEENHGKISVDSKEGQGTTFLCQFKRVKKLPKTKKPINS